MKYAILNKKNKCIAIANFSNGDINHVPLSEAAKPEDYLGKIYDFDNEEWGEDLQLDRIEDAVGKSHQDVIDEYTLELMEGGII